MTRVIESERKFLGLHGVRGCAALCVVLFHLQRIPSIALPGHALAILQHFYLAVLLFFVLSAFTLCHSDRIAPSTYVAYMAKRFFRIAPLFYVILIWNLSRSGAPDAIVILANVTFTFNLFPGLEQSLVWAGWAVGVEMLFYITLPALLIVCRGLWTSLAAFAAAVLCSITLWWVF